MNKEKTMAAAWELNQAAAVFVYGNMPDKDVLVCMEICKELRYNFNVEDIRKL